MTTTTAGFYRHRPTIIQAIQFTPQEWPVLRMWLDGELGRDKYHATADHLVLETREGDRDCHPGYWIVKEPGEFSGFYCIHPDLFPYLYEPSSATAYQPKHAAGGVR